MTRPTRAGFTLLEVMVAVVLLGLVTTALARGAMQALGYEGESERRTRASLLADQELWRVEAALRLATLPEVGRQEADTEDGFHVIVDVQPIVPGAEGIGALLVPPPPADGARATPPPGAAGPGPPGAPLISLLQVGVRVSWLEGLVEQAVTRTTFAYDASAAAQVLGADDEEEAAAEDDTAPPAAPGEEEVEEP